MKKLIYLILIITLISCGEPEVKDPVTGNWSYKSLDLSNTKPVINASFTIVPFGGTYKLENLSITINGSPSLNHSVVISDAIKGDRIGKIKFNNGEDIIEMIMMNQLELYPAWYIEKVAIENNNQIFEYSGQFLKAN